ncbi:MAG: DUF1345 domain-containing protein [Caulobacteraceae bacterium]|nr:DUF1345 domain-containing protein [Caulobacteraceae bacterium]
MMAHWRLGLGLLTGLIAWAVSLVLGAPAPARALIGWNLGAIVFILTMSRLFVTASQAEVRERAARQDETRGVILLLVAAAILASLAAIVAALVGAKDQAAPTRLVVTALAGSTLVTSWAVLQAVFVVHYAHRHFQAVEKGGAKAGFKFPGEGPGTYLDFAYLAICIGATAQVSDPSVQTTALRNLVTAHAVTSFFYNTAVLALGINILSGLINH